MYRSWLIPGVLLFLVSQACTPDDDQQPILLEPGVNRALAGHRSSLLENISYDLTFSLPEKANLPIPASVDLRFDLLRVDTPLILDFRQPADQVLAINVNGREVVPDCQADHVLIPDQVLSPGKNRMTIDFMAGEESLNRQTDYLYTLLVPDRASTVFPCFDQPNLKARYRLKLDLPQSWEASANSAVDSLWTSGDRKHVQFGWTQPFSTYVFGFAAGRFRKMTQNRSGRSMTMLFRETDDQKVAQNADRIFDLHAQSLQWMEAYTGFAMPFGKLDFVLIPGFQYGGMEHIGNIFYRESSLLLETDASRTQQLARARLIAHETAHMWFGNLVTMAWFDDVWLKEVFANFLAAKIVNPSFPDINHELNFLWSHLPSAYSEDRSRGTHPIQQELDNLLYAGSLYGRIIYQKAPVVMRQLESRLGEQVFRQGLQEYLQRFAFRNATWDDLIAILDRRTAEDLQAWSTVWVKQAGMPEYRMGIEVRQNELTGITIRAIESSEQGAYWDQKSQIALIYTPDQYERLPLSIAGAVTEVSPLTPTSIPYAILPNASSMSYGYFQLDQKSQIYLLSHAGEIADPVLRAVAYLSLYEACVRRIIAPERLFSAFRQALREESDPLNQQRLLRYLEELYWRYLPPQQRLTQGASFSAQLWAMLESMAYPGVRANIWQTFVATATEDESVQRLVDIWEARDSIPGLALTERRQIDLTAELAIRLPDQAPDLLQSQYNRINNPDQRARFAFLMPALSPAPDQRDQFFQSLRRVDNRDREQWVIAGLQYIHHPLRAASSLAYIQPALSMIEDIQATGDIFFPRGWVNATLSGHQSPEAAQIVLDFMETNPDLPQRLRNKIWMAADPLLRSAAWQKR